MRTLSNMIDMRRTESEKAKDSPMGLVTPSVSDLPDYDYGLSGSFNEESLEKLDLDSDVHVGDCLCIQAMARVTGIRQEPGSDKPSRVDFVMTHICADDDEESDDEAA